MYSCLRHLMKMAPLKLLDLPEDILFEIFRKYVPLKDKLYTLLEIPEFQFILKQRASYICSPVPFSFEYLKLLRQFRPGWYFSRDNWLDRCYLQIDESTLEFTMFYFNLAKRTFKPESYISFYCENVSRSFVRLSDKFYNKYSKMHLLYTYYLKNYGFVMILRYYDNSSLLELQFPYSKSAMQQQRIEFEKEFEIIKLSPFKCGFKGTLTRKKNLILQCTESKKCECENKIQELVPINFTISMDKCLYGGYSKIPLWACSNYRLENENDVKGFKIYHHLEPFVQRFEKIKPIVEEDKQDPRIKKFLF